MTPSIRFIHSARGILAATALAAFTHASSAAYVSYDFEGTFYAHFGTFTDNSGSPVIINDLEYTGFSGRLSFELPAASTYNLHTSTANGDRYLATVENASLRVSTTASSLNPSINHAFVGPMVISTFLATDPFFSFITLDFSNAWSGLESQMWFRWQEYAEPGSNYSGYLISSAEPANLLNLHTAFSADLTIAGQQPTYGAQADFSVMLSNPTVHVPDSGTSALLLGAALVGLVGFAGFKRKSRSER